jgi:predicted dehydrogenase
MAGLPVVALVGSNAAKTTSIAKELNVPGAYGDWHEVLQRDDVALVSIVTPPDLHLEMSVAALRAGKHVLCEKPTALNATQAHEMVIAASEHPDRLSIIDHELRFLPAMQLARQMIADGQIGRVRHIDSAVVTSSRFDPQREWNWWSDAARGGGLLGAVGSHQIDMARYMMDAEITTTSAMLNTFITGRPTADGFKPVTADDFFALTLRFTNGAIGTVRASAVVGVSEPETTTVYGTAGTLRWVGGQLLYAPLHQAFQDITPVHTYPAPAGLSGAFPHATVYIAHALRAYLHGEQHALRPAATFDDGLRIQEVLDAARRSHIDDGTAFG